MIDRYEDPRMRDIWSRQNQINLWARVERAWMRQHDEEAAHDAESVRAPYVDEVADEEARTRHEFTAFLDVWSRMFLSNRAQRWVHYGLTSSDVIDTATALQLVEAHRRLFGLVDELMIELNNVVLEIDPNRDQVGRTHGQWAQPRWIGQPLFVLASMLSRQGARMRSASHDLKVADLSGPTGAAVGLEPELVSAALRSLGLYRLPASTQILPRDGWVAWAHAVSGLVTICEAIADHYWFLAQDGIDEVTVGLPAPSSAMPHKRNPHLAENVRGLARMARHYASMLDESMVQRGDRDLAHSSVERVALPDLCHLAATALARTRQIVQTYQYDLDVVRGNLQVATVHGSARSHEEVMENVRQGMSRAGAIANEIKKENPHE